MRHLPDAVSKLGACFILLAALVCNASAETDAVWPTQQWQTSSPEQQGIDSAALARLVEFGQSRSLDSLLIARHGRIVLDAYYAPYTADIPHVVNSVTKAVIGTLTAIALKDGVLDNTSRPVMEFFGDRSIANLDDRKRAITIQNLLDMTSGLAWKEPLNDERPDSMFEMEQSPDWINYVLDRPMAGSPGDAFNYNSGNPHLLSAILAKLTGMSAEDYAKAKLFGPLGITNWRWRRDPQGVSTGGYGLALLPRDMAKFGYLYLRNGEWEGKPLVPPDWIDKVNHATVDMKASFNPALRYSNFFWALPQSRIYWANGYHCQTVTVYPSLDMIAVSTARDNCAFSKLATYIAEAVKSETALPPNPAGSELLDGAIRAIAIETPTERGATPPLAAAISGKTFQFQRNRMAVKSLALTLNDPQPHYELEIYGRDPTKPPVKYAGPIGLDGLYRKAEPSSNGVSAVKGVWLNGHTFQIDRLNVGASEFAQRWTLWFDGETLSIYGKDFNGRPASVDGRLGG
jgi:CubicO group peptidase (beta-lactamase class C family)